MPALRGGVFVASNDEGGEPFVLEHLACADGMAGDADGSLQTD